MQDMNDDRTVASMRSRHNEALGMPEDDEKDEEVGWDESHDISTTIDDINAMCNSLRSEAIKYRIPGLSDVLGDLLGLPSSMTLMWAKVRNGKGELDKLMSFLVKLQSMLSQNVGNDIYLSGDTLDNLRQSIMEVLEHERPSLVEEDQGPKPSSVVGADGIILESIDLHNMDLSDILINEQVEWPPGRNTFWGTISSLTYGAR